MRLIVVSAVLVAAGCASTPTDETAAIGRACSTTDCFLERDVRDFEVIDRTTVIVYVGSQRCAFQLELRGTFCDLTFAPELFFSSPNDLDNITSTPGGINGRRGADIGDDLFGRRVDDRSSDLRICANDLTIDVDGGVFTESASSSQPTDRFGNTRSQCQVASVVSLTDDQLVELYVDRGVAPPPPPMGSGQIEIEEQAEESAPSDSATTPEAGGENGGDSAAPASEIAATRVD
jgi:hypothetical protein